MARTGYVGFAVFLASILFCQTTCCSAEASPSCPLRYSLQRQHIGNWLVAGPQIVRLTSVDPFQGPDDDATKRNILRHYYRTESEVTELPCEGQAVAVEGATFPWRYCRCEDDHAVAFGQGGGCVYFKTWAYAQIDCPSACTGRWTVAAHGPVDVWVNGQRVLTKSDLSIFVPIKHDFVADLNQGLNEVLVRFEAVKIRVGVYGMALKLPDSAVGAEVVLPTSLPETVERQRAEPATSR